MLLSPHYLQVLRLSDVRNPLLQVLTGAHLLVDGGFWGDNETAQGTALGASLLVPDRIQANKKSGSYHRYKVK